ncbi:glycosyltransferase family 2 protein [Candidatus Chloroploca sp. M-50]|uniref:Glycosyltransferase family 2 protein n=1 Tax=Candidatus Chloroploca mongolica TaxID=2528176 RepID=A0ABS4D475_9CHLR|nr:glycosyltransferase family 2 protein [Candidatus Chloroploca mongolica]MBP1464227.1 glycosyltransferase family 2 protein [Candidatus Chloroploca mongolica]
MKAGGRLRTAILSLVRRFGLVGVLRTVRRCLRGDSYTRWVQAHRLTPVDHEQIRQQAAALPHQPLISVLVPVYNTPEAWLRACLDSVLDQLYPYWELCIADDASTQPHVRVILDAYAARDARIRVVYRTENGHIAAATNSALAAATGAFVAFLDHDDTLAPEALFQVALAINAQPQVDLLYSDEDSLDRQGHRVRPIAKPGCSPLLLRSHNYISHLLVIRRNLVNRLGGCRIGMEGAQDHDLILRAVEQLPPQHIHHISCVLYHWRIHPDSTAAGTKIKRYAAAVSRRAVAEHLQRVSVDARIESVPNRPYIHHVCYPVPAQARASVIIPTRDRLDLLQPCLDGLLTKTDFPELEVRIVDNGSKAPEVLRYLADLAMRPNVHVLRDDAPFNFSALCNLGARAATGELLCFLNNDISVAQPGWLRELAGLALQPGVGAVGPLLRYPDGRIQHMGIELKQPWAAQLIGHGRDYAQAQRTLALCTVRNVIAVTGACLVVSRAAFAQVGGFDERLPVAFNDVDLCLNLHAAGYWNLWTPFAELTHHHWATRGRDNTPAREARKASEARYLRQKWAEIIPYDPFRPERYDA